MLQGKGKAQAGSDSTPVRGPAEHQASHKLAHSATKSPGEATSTPNRRGSKAVADSDTPDSSGSSGGGGKQGRRARRKEKMASADARARLLSSP